MERRDVRAAGSLLGFGLWSSVFLVPLSPCPVATEDVEEDEEGDQGNEAVADIARDRKQLVPVLTDDVPDGAGKEGPDDGSGEAVGEESVVPHVTDPGEEWGHAAEAGTKASQEDRLATMLLKVVFYFAEALHVEDEGEQANLQDACQEGTADRR